MMTITRREIWFALFVIVVFAIGAMTGLVFARLFGGPGFGRYGPPRPPPPGIERGMGDRGPSPEQVVEHMTDELKLTVEQRKQVEGALRRGVDRLEAFRASTREQFESLREQMDREVEAALTPEQRARYRQLRPGPGKRRE
jgi:Spy/CpxP family protein refolding chaperone